MRVLLGLLLNFLASFCKIENPHFFQFLQKMIIGLSGQKNSGKDTVYEILKKHHPKIERIALADNLKWICCQVFKIPLIFFNDRELKEKDFEIPVIISQENILGIYEETKKIYPVENCVFKDFSNIVIKTPRNLLQFVGTEIIREWIHISWHLMAVLSKIKKDRIYVITDIRFENEYLFFEKHFQNFSHYRVFRKQETPSHSSEILFDYSAEIIFNNKTLEDLEIEVLQKIKIKN